MAYEVFMSHSFHDKEWVQYIADHLRRIDIQPYLFEYDIQPGRYHAEKVKESIDRCDSMIVLITKNSQFSPYVNNEIGYADAKEKLIIPLVEPDIDKSKLAMLDGRDYVSFDRRNPTQTMNQLSEYLLARKAMKDATQQFWTAMAIGLGLVGLFSANE